MGLAQGSQLKFDIDEALKTCIPLLIDHLGAPWWMPNFVTYWFAKQRAYSKFGLRLQRGFPQFDRQLRGIAEGAGIDMKTVYFLNALESAFSLQTGEQAVLPAPGACSAIAVTGSRSASGEPIITRNFDYLNFIKPYFMMRENRPAGGLRSLGFTLCPLVGTVDGINEAGLAITLNYAYTTDARYAAATISMRIGEALARCRTVAEAAQWLEGTYRWGGGILMLADAEGDIASLELSSTQSYLRRPANGEDLIFHTNIYASNKMQTVEVPRQAVFGPSAEPWQRGNRVHESAEERQARLIYLLSRNKLFGEAELRQVLNDHGVNGVPSDNTLCMHGLLRETTACTQLFPRSRRMKVSYTRACQAEFVDFAL
jgi:hypothetical protein